MEDELSPLHIDFIINEGVVKTAALNIEEQLKHTTLSAEQMAAIVVKAFNGAEIVNAVNKAKSGFNGLENSITQITRELPAFTFSAQTGFEAVSNNIGPLVDQINRVNTANRAGIASSLEDATAKGEQAKAAALQGGASEEAASQVGDLVKQQALSAAEGIKGAGVLKQLFGALFSWNTLISVGITLITVYGKEIGAWVTSLFRGKDAIDQVKNNFQALNEVIASANKEAGKQIATSKLLYEAATNENNSMKDRIASAQELKKQYAEQFGSAKLAAILNGEEKKSYEELTKSILAKAKASAAASKLQDIATQQLDLDDKRRKTLNVIKNEQNRVNGVATGINLGTGAPGSTISTEQQKKNIAAQHASDLKDIEDSKKSLQATADYLVTFAGGNAKVADTLNKNNKLIQEPLKNFNAIVAAISSKADVDNLRNGLQAKLNALAPDDKQIAVYQDRLRQVEAIEKKYAPKISDNNKAVAAAKQQDADAKALLKKQIELQQRIKDFTDKNEVKQLDPDQSALTQVSDQFENIKFKIKQANADYDAFVKKHTLGAVASFNANPANKVKLVKTDPNTLKSQEDDAISNQANLNENKYIQDDIENKKKLYADYTSYKEKLGKDAADKEFAELLRSGKDFAEYLNTLAKSVDASDLSGATVERKDLIVKAIRENNLVVLAALKDQLIKVADLTQTAANKEKQDEEQYQIDLALLRKSYSGDELATREANLADSHVKQLAATRQLSLEETAVYRDAMKDVTNDSLAELNTRIKEAKTTLESADLTPDQRKLAFTKVNKAESELNAQGYHHDQFGQLIDDENRVAKKAKEIQTYADATAQSFHELGDALAPFDEGLADTLNTIGDLASVAGNAAGSVASFASGDIVGGVQKAISAIAGVFKIFGAAKESARKAAEELQKYQDALLKGEIAYNALLRERAIAQDDITKLTITELRARQDMLKTQTGGAQSDYDRLLSQIQNSGQEVLNKTDKKYGGFLGIGRKTKVVEQTGGLSGLDYDALEKLYTEGKLTDSTKDWFEELKKVHDQMGDINDAAKEAADQIAQIATGTTASALSDAILQGLQEGKKTVADFGDFFQETMQKAGLSFFESEVVNKKMAAFYEEFAKAAEGGLTKDKIAGLKSSYNTQIADILNQYKDLTKIIGDPALGASSSSAVTGISKNITENTGNEINGRLGGIQLAVVSINTQLPAMGKGIQDGLVEMRAQTLLQIKIENNTKRTADVAETYLPYLKDIGKNQGDNLNTLLRAFGK